MTGPREEIYDKEIRPLMTKVIEICEREGIPIVANFELDKGDDTDYDHWLECCTTRVRNHDSELMKLLYLIVMGKVQVDDVLKGLEHVMTKPKSEEPNLDGMTWTRPENMN